MKLYFASGNAHKAAELQRLADGGEGGAGWIEIVSAHAVGGMPPVVEDTGTFVGNARKKAQALKSKLRAEEWALADDSGLCVDALGGAPGVESAYYAGPQGDGAANLQKLQRVMAGIPAGERGAHFVCVLLLIGPDERELVFEGLCAGRLLEAPSGGAGFGYDPLFVPEGFEQSFAALGDAAKAKLSHRARAWKKLATGLRELV